MQAQPIGLISKKDLILFVREALERLGGQGTIVEVAEQIWGKHKDSLEASGEIFYTWQYDMRWARHRLAVEGVLRTKEVSGRSVWILIK
jgi:hypothetical protein